MSGLRTKAMSAAPLLLVGAYVAGCAAEKHPALVDARMEYERTAEDPDIQKNAAVALYEAEQALKKAEREWEEDENFTEGEHDAYIVEKRLEIARAAAAREEAEALLEQSRDVRQQVVLEARENRIRELEAENTKRGLVLTIGDVLFEVDEASLKPGAQQNMRQLVTFLAENPDREVLIEGHTDSTGSDAYNRQLSQRRAEAVERYLTASGISPARILSRGYGEEYPVAPNDNVAGRQANRRVEVVILKEGERAADHVLGMRR